jgi:hypothetical protein
MSHPVFISSSKSYPGRRGEKYKQETGRGNWHVVARYKEEDEGMRRPSQQGEEI